MGFGAPFKYDHSGEKNLTRGKYRVALLQLLWDNNGMGKMDPRRNHPRLVQGPLARLFYGPNNDTQVLLNNNSGKSTLDLLVIEGYEIFCINLTVS